MPKNPAHAITNRARERLSALLEADVPMWKIAKVMKLGEETIKKYYPEVFDSFNITTRSVFFDPSPDQLRQVERMASLGMKTSQIALVIGVTQTTLMNNAKCRELVETSELKTQTAVGMNILRMATGDITHKNTVTAAVHYSKSKMGWKDANYDRGNEGGTQIFNQVMVTLPDNGRADGSYSGPVIEAKQDHSEDEQAAIEHDEPEQQ